MVAATGVVVVKIIVGGDSDTVEAAAGAQLVAPNSVVAVVGKKVGVGRVVIGADVEGAVVVAAALGVVDEAEGRNVHYTVVVKLIIQ